MAQTKTAKAKTAKAKPTAAKSSVKVEKKVAAKKPAVAAAKNTSAKPAPKPAAKKPQAAAKAAPAKPAAKKPVPAKPAASAAKAAPAKPAAPVKAAPVPKAAPKPRPAAVAAASADGFKDFTPYQPRSGEQYMSDGQVTHFRHLLGAWKKELMEKVDQTVHHMQDEAGNIPDPNDRASQESDFTMELRARDRERRLIKKIEESLGQLDAGEYGYCENCGEEIGVRRLEARPTATLCIECKTLDEIREKHVSRG